MVAGFLEVVKNYAGQNLPIAIGAGVAIVMLTVFFLMNRRRGGLEEAALSLTANHATKEDNALNWAPPEHSYADRRGSVRREGGPVRVLLSSSSLRNGLNDGYVVDRSVGGLRIAMSAALAPGSTVQVRAANAPDTIGFVTLIVRSCRKSGDIFEVGGEFEKTPPWNVLLLFG